jgi:hypothetical protein
MANYAFTVPMVPGKTETWKKYLQEMKGPRHNEFEKSRQRAGLRTEQVWLQQTPMGDMCVVVWDTDNPKKAFEYFMKSNDPADIWFRDKVLIECHNMNPSGPMPPINEQMLDNKGQLVGERTYAETKKR